MAGKNITPKQKKDALTLRAAGYSYTTISDMTGVSVSTLKRLFKEYNVSKGTLKKEAVQEATDALIHDANTIDIIKKEAASLILDDLALAKRLRIAMADAADQLVANNSSEALQVMRAISSGAVALKSTSETLRKTLGIDKDNNIDDTLPELTISIMTESQIEAVKQKARDRLAGVTDIDEDLSYDDEVVEYDDQLASGGVLHASN